MCLPVCHQCHSLIKYFSLSGNFGTVVTYTIHSSTAREDGWDLNTLAHVYECAWYLRVTQSGCFGNICFCDWTSATRGRQIFPEWRMLWGWCSCFRIRNFNPWISRLPQQISFGEIGRLNHRKPRIPVQTPYSFVPCLKDHQIVFPISKMAGKEKHWVLLALVFNTFDQPWPSRTWVSFDIKYQMVVVWVWRTCCDV